MTDPNVPHAGSVFSALAGPLRWTSWFLWSIGALTLAGLLVDAVGGEAPGPGAFAAPLVVAMLGYLSMMASRRCRDPRGLELPAVAGLVFMTVGGIMVAGGIILVFEEPGGFVLIVMGLVFVGAGYAARRFLATPPGQKAVAVSSMRAGITTRYGTKGMRAQHTIIHVDEHATAQEIEAKRREWLQEQMAAREDWITGRVEGEDQRGGTLPYWAAAVWILFSAVMSAAAFFWDDALWIFAGVAALMTLGFITHAVRVAWRRRKFGASHFQMAPMPAHVGGRLCGQVHTGVDQRLRPRGPFTVTLQCLHCWEERDHERRTRARVDVLWQDEVQALSGAWGAAPMRHAVEVDFELPADRPATTLGGGSEGIRWVLEVRASMPGLDYLSRFRVPVLNPEESVPPPST